MTKRILDYDNIIIFGHPRCASKLISQILVDFEYHGYGEWYDVNSSGIVGNVARRKSLVDIKRIRDLKLSNLEETRLTQNKEIIKLNDLWKSTNASLNPQKWVLTLWPYELENFPFLLETYRECHWVCPVRDRWSQLLSWLISYYNYNFNSVIESKSITVSKNQYNFFYWSLLKVENNQNWILENFSSTKLLFDEVISGNAAQFGKEYTVKTKDEHQDLESLISNIDDVREWFIEVEIKK